MKNVIWYVVIIIALCYYSSVSKASPEVITPSVKIQMLKDVKADFLVVYTAVWCGYCAKLKPELKALNRKIGIEIVFVDIDKYPTKGLAGVPATDIYLKGEKVGRRIYGHYFAFDIDRYIKSLKIERL